MLLGDKLVTDLICKLSYNYACVSFPATLHQQHCYSFITSCILWIATIFHSTLSSALPTHSESVGGAGSLVVKIKSSDPVTMGCLKLKPWP